MTTRRYSVDPHADTGRHRAITDRAEISDAGRDALARESEQQLPADERRGVHPAVRVTSNRGVVYGGGHAAVASAWGTVLECIFWPVLAAAVTVLCYGAFWLCWYAAWFVAWLLHL